MLKNQTRWRLAAVDFMALLAGAVLPLAFAPFRWFPLAVISPAILFLTFQSITPRRALWRGWLFSLGLFGVGVSWVQISVHQFGLPVLAFSVSITALFVAFLALFPALTGYLANRYFPENSAIRMQLVLPALWVLMEWVRGWFLTGFPWLNLGYSQIHSPLAGLAPIAGVYGVSLAAALSAGLLSYLCLNRRRVWRLALLAGLWAMGWLAAQVSWTTASPVTIRAVLIQGNVGIADKWLPEQRATTLDQYLLLTEPHWGSAQLIVWPETAIPAFYSEVKHFIAALQRRAEETETTLLTGIPFRNQTMGEYYNSVIELGADPGIYHKQHLVPFGEFMPFAPVFGAVLDFLDIPMSSFSRGNGDQQLLRVAGQAVGVSICYEDAFGEEVIKALPEAQFLVNVSNDAWFGHSIAPHQHLEIAQMRALETGRYLLRSTNTGISAVISPSGKVIARSPQFQPHALTAEIHPHRGATPYARFGNTPVVLLMAGLLGVAALAQKKA
jgi:apolipoprotein N-acyltransferase